MDFNERIEELNSFQNYFLDFLEKDEQFEDDFQQLCTIFSRHNMNENRHDMKPFIKLIQNILHNHYHSTDFYSKIFRVLIFVLSNIKQIYSNYELFHIFKGDKRILLFLIENGFLTIDSKIESMMNKGKYNFYHYPEYFNLDKTKENDDKNYMKKRCIGENDHYICELIRNDSVEEFISYVNQKCIPLKKFKIQQSIYETNSFLNKNSSLALIEYAAFFGAIQIFRYLYMNDVELPSSLWEYVIHSNNAEMIHILEEQKISPKYSYKSCLKEAIKCHHNNIAKYIQINLIDVNQNVDFDVALYALKYHNYEFFPTSFNDNCEKLFIYACKYDHFYIAGHILSENKININKTIKCPYKRKQENLEEIENDEIYSHDESFLKDWTSWNEISKEVRNNERIKTKNYWKNHYVEQKICALHAAVDNEDIDIINLLLKIPTIDVNQVLTRYYIKSEYRYDPLDIKREEKTALHIAIEKGNLDIINLILQNSKINSNAKLIDCYESENDTREIKMPIHIAIENEQLEIVKILTDFSGININEKCIYERWWNGGREEYEEKTALNLAVEKGNLEIFKTILSHKNVDVNKELMEFYTTKNLSYVHKRKETSLHIAIRKKQYEMVKLILSNKKTDHNALSIKEYRYYQYERKKQFKTPLFLAIENNDIEMIKILLDNNCVDFNFGLLNIGGGSNLIMKLAIHDYNPRWRKDINRSMRQPSNNKLSYLNKRKDNYTDDGGFSQSKKLSNDQRYFNFEEEEDTNDDLCFKYRVFEELEPIEAAQRIGDIRIINLLEKYI